MERPFTLSVKVLVYSEDRQYLLLRRSDGCQGHPGRWELPGGKLEEGEALDQALRREVAEETGLQVEPRQLTETCIHRLDDRDIVYLVFEAMAEQGPLELSVEHEEAGWYCADAVAQLDVREPFKSILLQHAADAKTTDDHE